MMGRCFFLVHTKYAQIKKPIENVKVNVDAQIIVVKH